VVKAAASAVLAQQPAVRLEYLEVVDPEEMQPVGHIAGPVRVAAAVWLGSTRLIDNMLCEPGPAESTTLIQ
jgi:pantothenate synthetase